jgi:hypothetical protein
MTVGVDDGELTLLTWRQNDPFKNNSCGGSVWKKAETSRSKKIFAARKLYLFQPSCLPSFYDERREGGGVGERARGALRE